MNKNLMRISSILAILILALTVFGCQGYESPEYKAPDADDGQAIEIDVSDLGEEAQVEEPMYEEVVYEEPKTRYNEVVSEKPKVVYTEAVVDEDDSSFKKSAYKPVFEDKDVLTTTVTEGDLVAINVMASDKDGDILSYRYTAPLNSEGKWQTRRGDVGAYYSTITVSDGKTEIVKEIKIVVDPENEKPVLAFIPDVTVKEGSTVTLKASVSDKDGDRLTVSYSGWMNSETKAVGYNDEGEHTVTVSVTDGISTTSQKVKVTVLDVNRAPEVEIEF